MATALAGSQAIGQYDVCILRAGRLNADCSPYYGSNGGIITAGIVDMTASAELKAGANVELENGCGELLLNVAKRDRVKFRNLSGSFGLFDYEMMEILFGGHLIHGAAGTDFAGEVIGWGEPGIDDDDPNPCVLEVIVKNAGKGLGACQTPGSSTDYPTYTGYIFPKCALTFGERSFAQGGQTLTFTGKSEQNPNYGSGPWRDWDNTAAEVFPTTSPMVMVGYDNLAAILATSGLSEARVGYVSTPAAS